MFSDLNSNTFDNDNFQITKNLNADSDFGRHTTQNKLHAYIAKIAGINSNLDSLVNKF